ncbi:MAG TPA: long-chain fatty acid--CoA ligase [Pseudonocardia sp.]|nr:long-chain fatty acid--CoA ligase [Pseudonocardia sp.]
MIKALSSETLCEAFQITAAERADGVALRTKGDTSRYTWNEYAERVRTIAAGLAALGVSRGEPVGLLLTNRPEFHIVDAAAMHLGAIPFSMYNTAAPDQLAFIARSSGFRVLITERSLLEKALPLRQAGSALEQVVLIDGDSGDSGDRGGDGATMSLDALEAGASPEFPFEERWRSVQADDVATLIYTSGTTGPPKCVQITHRNLLREWAALNEVFDISPGGRILSWLPAAHIADRLLGQYQQICFGHTVTCVPDARQLAEHLVEVRPTFWVAVPRIYEKFRSALESRMTDEQHAALDVGLRKVRAELAGETVESDLLAEYERHDREVFAPIRASLGLDRAEQFVVGASPIPVAVLEFFHALGMPVCEVWGMSELPIATANPPSRPKLGSVGPPVPGVEVRLAHDGEVLVRGPMVMKGYRGDPEKTAEALDGDGWYATGDVGVLDEDGYITIVDRKKELIISSTGKNMSPSAIEAELKSASSLIGQAMAVGDGRPYNVALVVLDPESVEGKPDETIRQVVERAVAEANEKLSRPEQIKRYRILSDVWAPGGDELTPTSKLKRRAIAEKYATVITELYEGTTT